MEWGKKLRGRVNQGGSDIKAFQAAYVNTELTLVPTVKVGEYVYSNEPVGINIVNDTYTKLLLHMDGANGGTTFTDSSLVTKTPSTVTATTSTDSPKFGTASGRFVEASITRIVYANSADWNFGTDDFTIDFWIKRNGNQVNYTGPLGTMQLANEYGWAVYGNLTGENKIYLRDFQPVDFTPDLQSNTALPNLQWVHIAIVRYQDVVKIYFNGVLDCTPLSVVGKVYNSSGYGLSIGGLFANSTSSRFSGNLDELRISKGIARWTSNFTPPTAPYTTILSGILIPSIETNPTLQQITSTEQGPLKTYGSTVKRYSGFVSKRAVGTL